MEICREVDGLLRHNFGDVRLTRAGDTKECACGTVVVVAEMDAERTLWVIICTKVE